MTFNRTGSSLAVVPAYNEGASIARVIGGIRARAPHFDIVVIDDGSTDETARRAAQAGAMVVRAPFNLGIGGAVQTGFLYALEHGYRHMVQVDADGQHDPREIGRLRDAMTSTGVDMVCGSRFIDRELRYPAPISRRTGIHIFAFLLSGLIRQRVTAPTSGFRLYNREAIRLFARDYPHDYPEVEAVLMLHHHRLTMREVRVRMFERGGGVSSIDSSGKSAYYMVKVLLALGIGLARRRPTVEAGDDAPVSAVSGL